MPLFTKSYALGLLFILAVAIIWAGASVLIQYIYQDLDFQSPFLLTYIANSLLALYLPLWQVWILCGVVTSNEGVSNQPSPDPSKLQSMVINSVFEYEPSPDDYLRDESGSHMVEAVHESDSDRDPISDINTNPSDETASRAPESFRALSLNDTVGKMESNEDMNGTHQPTAGHNRDSMALPAGFREAGKAATSSILPCAHYNVIKMAALVCPFWFLSNLLYNYSLFMTSVSSSTIISNLSGAFTLAFSYFCGIEEITRGKVLGIMVCFAGAVCVALQDSSAVGGDGNNQQNHTISGDIVALMSAAGYGLYTSMIRYLIPDDEGVSMQLLLGYIGLLNAVFLAPILIVLYVMHLDNLASLTGIIFGFIVLNGLCNNVLSDYLWARAVVLTSPTVATIGMSVTIPLAMLSDFALWNAVPTWLSSLGAFLVLVGFVLVNVTEEHELALREWCTAGCKSLPDQQLRADYVGLTLPVPSDEDSESPLHR